jgi:hypothetical protein
VTEGKRRDGAAAGVPRAPRRQPSPRVVAIAASIPLLAGCAAGGSLSDLPVSDLRGHATVREEGRTWFTACGASVADSVWVTFTGRSVAQREELTSAGRLRAGSTWWVHWLAAEGDTTTGERVGPGERYILVQDFLEIRPPAGDDCPPPR